ncbi:hypothetical protein PR048_031572 [Dryococelus australis]|uniref:Uncharacterized protein n=1 Tax=Dryococelus australis TaxID=614101 RepID=A0ABQ9G5N7_9NEOP|nr:hypothetical protein PR048_031572 [Dryococelus australis]
MRLVFIYGKGVAGRVSGIRGCPTLPCLCVICYTTRHVTPSALRSLAVFMRPVCVVHGHAWSVRWTWEGARCHAASVCTICILCCRAILTGVGLYSFVLSKKSVDRNRYEAMKVRQRIRDANKGEYEAPDRKFN